MNEVADLSVVVVFPESSMHVSDLLWSTLREDSPALDIVVVVDRRNSPDVAMVVDTVARSDARVRLVDSDSGHGRSAALAAGLERCSAPWVAVADADGLSIRGGYRDLVASLQASGSDMAVGVVESIAKHRYRIGRATEGALDTDAKGIGIADRPGLISDDILCGKVVRRDLIRSLVHAEDPWLEEMLVARLYLAADRIDILSRSVVFCRDRPSKTSAAPMSPHWVKDEARIWAVLAAAPLAVRESYARELISRDVLSAKSLALLATAQERPDARDLVIDLTGVFTKTSLSNLTIWKRWQLALIALGQPALVDVARPDGRPIGVDAVPNFDSSPLLADAWAPLGLRADEDIRDAVIARFVSRRAANTGGVIDADSDGIDISVIIPTYNVVDYVDELLESIRASVGVRIEIIVIDDGSTDGTRDRVLAHQEVDARVRLVRSPGAGGGQARDAGIELARGRYLAFADGDDVVPPRAYAHLLSLARRSDADVINGSYLKFFTTSTWDAGTGFNQAYALPVEDVTIETHPQLVRHRAVWNRLIRREHWQRTAFPFPGVPRSNDIVAMTSALLSARSIAVSPLPAYVYRDRPGGGSMTSRAGSADYTVSYFSEEATCAALVQQRESAPVSREYWAMVLAADAWHNIGKFLERRSGDHIEDRRVAEQITKLLARAPRMEFSRLKAENQAVWALAAEGRFNEARIMLRAEKSASSLSAGQLVRAISTAEALPTIPRASIDSLALKYLMRRFISDASWQTDEFSPALPVLRRRLTDPVFPLSVVPNSLEERLARAIVEGDDIDLARQAISPPSSAVAATLRTGLRTTLTGAMTGTRPGGVTRLVARRYRDRERVRVPIRHFDFGEDSWSAEIAPGLFPRAGVWVMELEYEDSLGMRRSLLKIDEVTKKGVMPRRFHRLTAASAGKNRSIIRVRESLVERVGRKASRIVSRRG
jgi:glycosyltransferase involved in cell wall biosynthesis